MTEQTEQSKPLADKEGNVTPEISMNNYMDMTFASWNDEA